ncbi:MAG: hypothetical protein HY089_04335 [Ignavibacteriales bacterium]|nr:hypothetical protein [Ignavibacteriales bacterium]
MKKRIFLWGLSNGIIALTIAALFWLGLGLGPYADKVQWYVDALVMLVVYGSCGVSIWEAIRLRRRSGFQRSDLKPSDPDQRAENRRIVLGFVGVVVVQAILVALTVIWCLQFPGQDIMWSLIALIISLHFIPLGRVFKVRPYFFVGAIGSIVSISSFAAFIAPYRLMYLGVALGIVMIGSAAYLIWKADEIALKATGGAQEDRRE